jgi:hypothetical protein
MTESGITSVYGLLPVVEQVIDSDGLREAVQSYIRPVRVEPVAPAKMVSRGTEGQSV